MRRVKKRIPKNCDKKKQYLPDAQSYLPTFEHKWVFCGINVGNYTNTLNVECLGLQDLYRKHSEAAICCFDFKSTSTAPFPEENNIVVPLMSKILTRQKILFFFTCLHKLQVGVADWWMRMYQEIFVER